MLIIIIFYRKLSLSWYTWKCKLDNYFNTHSFTFDFFAFLGNSLI